MKKDILGNHIVFGKILQETVKQIILQTNHVNLIIPKKYILLSETLNRVTRITLVNYQAADELTRTAQSRL